MYIYITTNLVNGKQYIGQTTRSIKESTQYYGSGVNISKAIKKYGRHNFKKEVIEEFMEHNQELLDEREIYWIAKYDAVNSTMFYNAEPGGIRGSFWSSISINKSLEVKEKISRAVKHNWVLNKKELLMKKEMNAPKLFKLRRNKFLTLYDNIYQDGGMLMLIEHKRRAFFREWISINNKQDELDDIKTMNLSNSKIKHQEIYMFTLDGEMVTSFDNLVDALDAISTNSKGNLLSAIKGNRNTCGGFRWSYSNKPNDLITKKRIYKKTGKQKNPSGHKNRVRAEIVQLTKDGDVINTFYNKEEAAKETGFSAQMILRCAKADRIYKGYKWKRKLIKETIKI